MTDLPGMWEDADLSGGWADSANASEPCFKREWYERDIRSQMTTEFGGEIGNSAYMEWMEEVLQATGRNEIDWGAISLAVVLDREVRADEARRAREVGQED